MWPCPRLLYLFCFRPNPAIDLKQCLFLSLTNNLTLTLTFEDPYTVLDYSPPNFYCWWNFYFSLVWPWTWPQVDLSAFQTLVLHWWRTYTIPSATRRHHRSEAALRLRHMDRQEYWAGISWVVDSLNSQRSTCHHHSGGPIWLPGQKTHPQPQQCVISTPQADLLELQPGHGNLQQPCHH